MFAGKMGKRCFSCEERVVYDIQQSKDRENQEKERQMRKTCSKKGHQKFLPRKWEFFQKKAILVRENVFRPLQTRRQVSATATLDIIPIFLVNLQIFSQY